MTLSIWTKVSDTQFVDVTNCDASTSCDAAKGLPVLVSAHESLMSVHCYADP